MNNITFDQTEFISFLGLLISESEHLQNGNGFTAQESRAANHVINKLQPYIDSGKIICKKVEYVANRANLILEYGDFNSSQSITFAGSHFDVVPANPSEWDLNPFELNVKGDMLHGRGTTDCLGHVALTTLLLEQLALNNVQLNYKFIVVFIADEEVGKDHDIGVLHLEKDGYLNDIKNGPVYWIDASDVNPTLSCGSGMAWSLTVHGKKAHSGFLHNGINAIPIAMEAIKAIIQKFNELCPRISNDDLYGYKAHSNMKPTMWNMSPGSSPNQFPDWVEIVGDVRMTPFYDAFYIKDQISQFVSTLDIESLPQWHDHFKTSCTDNDGNTTNAKIEFKWVFGPYCGVVCDINSKGYKLIEEATTKYHGSCKGCSDLGSIPLVKDMQNAGIDIQIIGYGNTIAYHANNEFCTLSGMEKGFNILKSLLDSANNV